MKILTPRARVKLNRVARWVENRFFRLERLRGFVARDQTLTDQWLAALRALNMPELKRLRDQMNDNYLRYKGTKR